MWRTGEPKVGGESLKVGELSSSVIFDLDAYPEPKILSSAEIKKLVALYGSTTAVARFLGCSQSFVSERLNQKINKNKGEVMNKTALYARVSIDQQALSHSCCVRHLKQL
jgi:hypothetical protein